MEGKGHVTRQEEEEEEVRRGASIVCVGELEVNWDEAAVSCFHLTFPSVSVLVGQEGRCVRVHVVLRSGPGNQNELPLFMGEVLCHRLLDSLC